MANYAALIEVIKTCPPGAVLEIGAFTGVGTAELCKTGRRVIACDNFDAANDPLLGDLYRAWLGNQKQTIAFIENVQHYDNVEIRRCDSFALLIDEDLAFTFIDGAHDFDHVINDFWLAWAHTVPGGWVVFHDYQHDLPEVTRAVDQILEDLRGVVEYHKGQGDCTLYIQKPLC